jgi:hypothetical protein
MRKCKKLNFPYIDPPVDRFMICDKCGILKTFKQILGDKEPHQELWGIFNRQDFIKKLALKLT